MTVWNLNKPDDNDPLSELDSVVSNQRTAFEERIETHFHWSDATEKAGFMKQSFTTPSGARVFYGPRSEVSYPGDGAGMIVSDESRLLLFHSGGSILAGSSRAPLQVDDADPVVAEKDGYIWYTQVGLENISSAAQGIAKVVFATAYNSDPKIQLTLADGAKIVKSAASYALAVTDVAGSGFSLAHNYVGPGAGNSPVDVHWRSTGTVTI